MTDQHDMRKDDVGRLLKDNFKEAEMDAIFRESLLRHTRSTVARRSSAAPLRWAALLAAGFGLALLIVLSVLRFGSTPGVPTPGNGGSGLTADAPPTVPSQTVQNDMSSKPQDTKGSPREQSVIKKTLMVGAPKTGTHQDRIVNTQPKQMPKPKLVAQVDPLVVITLQGDLKNAKGHLYQRGDKVSVGTVLKTGKHGQASLVSRKGARIYLDSNTVYQYASHGLSRVTAGRIFVSNRAKEIEQITTPAGEVHLLGTEVDTAVIGTKAVAVTVVSGKVKIHNSRGQVLVDAGKKAVIKADEAPAYPISVNASAETAWYDGRGKVVSDFGKIAYVVNRDNSPISELWTMNADGSEKHRVRSFVGIARTGSWLPGDQWLQLDIWSAIWTTPDFKSRRATSNAGHPIVKTPLSIINVATGQDTVFGLPEGYNPLYTALSPNGRYMAFTGSYSDPSLNREGGLWVYDTWAGDVRKLLSGWLKTAPAWGSDSERVAVSEGESYGTDHPLAIVDILTGDIQRPGIQGAGPAISPDGKKMAYVGDYKAGGSWHRGVPTTGSIFVADIAKPDQPVRISPEGDGSIEPSWSPDGTRILYLKQTLDWSKARDDGGHVAEHYSISIAKADGSETRLVFQEDLASASFISCGWGSDGKSVYVRKRDGILQVAADGSGLIASLGGGAKDSIVSGETKEQTEKAASAVEEAIFQFAVGNVRTFDGKPKEAREAFLASNNIFSSLSWTYPLADFSTSNTLRYADRAVEEASRTDEQFLAESCKQRLTFLGAPFGWYVREKDSFPSDLQTLEKWAVGFSGSVNWLTLKEDPARTRMLFQCPGTAKSGPVPYIYTVPAKDSAKAGDIIVTCPNHPQNKLEIQGYWLKK